MAASVWKGSIDTTINQRLRANAASGFLRLKMEFPATFYRFQIYEYSQRMDDNVEKEISCDVTLKIIDMILLNETSLNKPTVGRKGRQIMAR